MPSFLPISWANSPQTHCDWIQGAQFLKECVSVVFIFIGHDSRQNHFSEICFWLHVWYEEKEREWSGHSSDPRSAIQNDTRMQLEFEHAPAGHVREYRGFCLSRARNQMNTHPSVHAPRHGSDPSVIIDQRTGKYSSLISWSRGLMLIKTDQWPRGLEWHHPGHDDHDVRALIDVLTKEN